MQAQAGLKRLDYRPDIDGLRAIAVLAVVAYHAFPAAVPGGFVGVDIFFVVSGYLISTIILDSLGRGAFTFREFYARRIRRIFPALVVVLATTLAIGWFVQVPGEYAALGRHTVGGALFFSNLQFWQESGYFDAAAELKPLLHLWSLSVEEQFYLIWPFLLWLAQRGRRRWLALTVGIGLASLAIAIWQVAHAPTAAFYLPLSRFWELMLGSTLAYAGGGADQGVMARWRGALASNRAWREALPVAGLGLIGASMLAFDAETPFPGAAALLPTLGAWLLIASGPSTRVARALSLKPIVFVGLISYPLYLWHWPLLSFARIEAAGEPALSTRLALVALSLLLASITYRYVERPLRFTLPPRRAVALLLAMMALVATAGAIVAYRDGFVARAPDPVRRYANYRYDFQTPSREGSCSLVGHEMPAAFPERCIDPAAAGKPLVVLWGDSHNALLYPGLRAIADERFRIAQFTRSGCRPFLEVGFERCREGNAWVMRKIDQLQPDTVVLFALWNHLKFRNGAEMLQQLEPTIAALKRNGIPKIVVLGPAPRWRDTLPKTLLRLYERDPYLRAPARTRFGLNPDAAELDRYLQSTLGRRNDIVYVSAYRMLCDARGCLTRIGNDPDQLTTWDYGHLTLPASSLVARELESQLSGFGAARKREAR